MPSNTLPPSLQSVTARDRPYAGILSESSPATVDLILDIYEQEEKRRELEERKRQLEARLQDLTQRLRELQQIKVRLQRERDSLERECLAMEEKVERLENLVREGATDPDEADWETEEDS